MDSADPRSAALNPQTHELTLIPFSFWLQHSNPTPDPGGEPRLSGQGVAPCRNSASSSTEPSGGALSPRALDHARPGPFWDARAQGGGGPPLALAGLQQAMADHLKALGHPGAEPLRWAITGVDPQRGLWLEGIGLSRTAERPDRNRGPAATADPLQQAPGLGPADPHA